MHPPATDSGGSDPAGPISSIASRKGPAQDHEVGVGTGSDPPRVVVTADPSGAGGVGGKRLS
jgi:hypothetical protein